MVSRDPWKMADPEWKPEAATWAVLMSWMESLVATVVEIESCAAVCLRSKVGEAARLLAGRLEA